MGKTFAEWRVTKMNPITSDTKRDPLPNPVKDPLTTTHQIDWEKLTRQHLLIQWNADWYEEDY